MEHLEYNVIEAKGQAFHLTKAVNEQIQDGWEPVGGIAVACSPNGAWWYYQAMIRTLKPPDMS
jgi:hypothetical protein